MDRPQRLARKAEQETARLHGGRVTPQSGSGRSVKNDVRNDTWSFEVKATTQKGYRLTVDSLLTAEKNALADGRKMAFLVAFMPAISRPWEDKRYILMTEDDFLELDQELARLRQELDTAYQRGVERGLAGD